MELENRTCSKRLQLGCVANTTLGFDGCNYRYQTNEWRYIERVATLFDKIDICTTVVDLRQVSSEIQARYSHTLRIPNGVIHNLPEQYRSVGIIPRWPSKQLSTFRKLCHVSKGWDLAFFMTPGWPALMSWLLHYLYHWPYAVFVRLDWVGAINRRLLRGWKKWLFLPYLHLFRRIEAQILYDASIRMANGLIVSQFPDLADSTLLTADVDLSIAQFRRRYDTCVSTPVRLICVASLEKRKGINLIIRAMAQLVAQGLELEFHIVGDGPEWLKLEQLSTELRLNEQIKFHGYIPNGSAILDMYYQSDIFVLASYGEGFPRVVYEAVSQSLPIVITPVGGVPYILKDKETALFIEPGNVQSIVDAIERVVTDKSLRQGLIQRGYEMTYQLISSDPLEQAAELFQQKLSTIIR